MSTLTGPIRAAYNVPLAPTTNVPRLAALSSLALRLRSATSCGPSRKPHDLHRHRADISGHLHSHVDGVPVFRAGEEVYLFLWERPGEPYRVLGWPQGTFRIARNADTGVETVTQDSAMAPIFDLRTRTSPRVSASLAPLR